jgi:hypothetical protein
MLMKPNSRSRAALAFILFVSCVIGCKSGRSSNSESSTRTASNSNAASVPAPPPPNISGKYNIVGTNPSGTIYRGQLEVIKHGDVYQFRWNAGNQYDGVGVQNGKVVAVAFASGANGKGCGVVDYDIASDGSLDGKWGYWGTNESGTETATRTSGPGLEGEYDGSGKNPNGTRYSVKIAVEPAAGNLYRFSWSNNTEGVGIKRGNNIAVGIGGARCGFVTYEVMSDGTLDGIWGGYGSDKTGTEKATKQ